LDAGADSASKPTAAVSFERIWPDPQAGLPRGPEQTARVCARPGSDPVRDVFCGPQPQPVNSLADLRQGLKFGMPAKQKVIDGVAVAAHSTSLAARSVSTINPRVIAMRMTAPLDVVALGFTRGEQFAELVAYDRNVRTLRFYLVGYRQACNDAPDGCKPGDLLTPAVEEDWRDVTLYDDQDLTNTPLDCMTCHQPGGLDTPRLLRMNELATPWTHWFAQDNEGGRALVEDYVAAKGDERIAGMDATSILDSRPTDLEQLVRFVNKQPQPMDYNSDIIEREVRGSASGQPFDNSVPGSSPTWRELFTRAQSGATLTVPYHDVKITDPEKLARASAAYSAFRAGQLERAALPDIRDVLPDDEGMLAEMGMMTTPGADGAAVLTEACSLCHNARLDPKLTRARFRADLVGISAEEKAEAVRRLMLPPDNPLAMPPARLRALSQEARARAIEALQR
jgi:mono/diheme cytochrome c family protein